jgi:hypothetical protein
MSSYSPNTAGSCSSCCRTAAQLEGELMVMSGRYEVGGVVFDPWEIEELEDLDG